MTTTREQILSMPAGREMDALVAKSLGIPVCECESRSGYTDCGAFFECASCSRMISPEFSTDIAAAWQVVEKVDKNYWPCNPVRISRTLSGWACRIRTSTHSHVVANADTAPEAICRAALLATLEGQ